MSKDGAASSPPFVFRTLSLGRLQQDVDDLFNHAPRIFSLLPGYLGPFLAFLHGILVGQVARET